MNKFDPFFRVNEASEPLNAVVLMREFLERSEQDIYNLKWTIIAAHNALQGFMVLALKGTSNLPITKWKKEYNKKSVYEVLSDPKSKLCDFLILFEKIKSDEYMQNAAFKEEGTEITSSIDELNNMRNQFIHYLPCLWSIETQLVIDILTDTLKVISFLARDCIEVQKYYNERQLAEISAAIESSCMMLKQYGDEK